MAQRKPFFLAKLSFVTLVAIGTVAALLGLAYWGGALHFGAGDYHIDAVMPTASALQPHARVTMAGAQVGQVASITRQGNGAVVQLDIGDHAVTPIPADSHVQLSVVTPIGENYVQIIPGKSKHKLSSGSELPMSSTDAYVDVDQILSLLQGSTTQRTRQLVAGLGAAVDNRGTQLNQTLAGVSNTFTPLANVVQILNNDHTSTDKLVLDLGQIASEAGQRGQSIIQLADEGLTTFNAIAAQDNGLRATLDQLPSTLGQVRTTAGTLDRVTNTAAPVLNNLASAVHNLRPAVTSLGPAADEGHTVLNDLAAAAPQLKTTLADTRSLSKPAPGALSQTKYALCQVNPMLRYVDPNPSSSAPNYVGDIIQFVSGFGSAVNAYDNIGHLVRLVPVLGDNSINGLPPQISTAAYDLMHAGFMANSTALTWDPYPAPGLIGTEHATASNEVIGPSQLKAKSGYVYPHVSADC